MDTIPIQITAYMPNINPEVEIKRGLLFDFTDDVGQIFGHEYERRMFICVDSLRDIYSRLKPALTATHKPVELLTMTFMLALANDIAEYARTHSVIDRNQFFKDFIDPEDDSNTSYGFILCWDEARGESCGVFGAVDHLLAMNLIHLYPEGQLI